MILRWREQLAVLHQHDIARRAFGQVAVPEQDRLHAAAVDRRQTQQLATIDGQHLVNAVAEQEAAIEYRNPGLIKRDIVAVQIDHRQSLISYFHMSRKLSQERPRKPATGTLSSATIGYSPTPLPSRLSLTLPTFWPDSTGAISGCTVVNWAFSLGNASFGKLS